MSRELLVMLFVLAACVVCLTLAHEGNDHDDHDHDHDHGDDKHDSPEDEVVDMESLEYQKGSLCGYCDYCKVIRLYL